MDKLNISACVSSHGYAILIEVSDGVTEAQGAPLGTPRRPGGGGGCHIPAVFGQRQRIMKRRRKYGHNTAKAIPPVKTCLYGGDPQQTERLPFSC